MVIQYVNNSSGMQDARCELLGEGRQYIAIGAIQAAITRVRNAVGGAWQKNNIIFRI
jgi:hypothetical protein